MTTFPLESVVAARAETWSRLNLTVSPHRDDHVVSTEFESPAWVAEIMVWPTGEAELATVRLTDDRMVSKHYDLSGPDRLDALLDEFVALLAEDRIPEGAVVARWPGTPA